MPRLAKARGTDLQYDVHVDAYINKAKPFAKPILEHLRAAVHSSVPNIRETMKWSRPFFLLNDAIFCNMSAFAEHCAFGFWSARMTETLSAEGIDGAGSSGSLGRIASVGDLPAKGTLDRYLKLAAQMVERGEYGPGLTTSKEPRSVKAPLPVPPEFEAALARSREAQANFAAFPPSCRREYIAWITSAKKPETRERRMQTALESIAAKRKLNDAYR